jgi:hypothetical protein
MEFIDQKRDLFWTAAQADPLDFADRVAARFLGVTVWYEPFSPNDKTARPVVLWVSRAWYPLPFLALVFLTVTAIFRPLHRTQWIVIGAYLLYSGPYIAMSYYERYGVPLLAIKVLLMIWAADRLLCLLWPPRPTGVHQRQERQPTEAMVLPAGRSSAPNLLRSDTPKQVTSVDGPGARSAPNADSADAPRSAR